MPHLFAELFSAEAGVDTEHGPYKGGGPLVTDPLADQDEMGCPAGRQNARDGRCLP